MKNYKALYEKQKELIFNLTIQLVTAEPTTHEAEYKKVEIICSETKLRDELAALEAEQVKDQYGYPLTTTNNHVEFSQSEHRESAEEIASKQVRLYLNGKSEDPTKDLYNRFIKAMEQYAQQRMPTEEEIEKQFPYARSLTDYGAQIGAKWAIEQIKQLNNLK